MEILKQSKVLAFMWKKGIFFAFLSPNGAGKSTTINIIDTLIKSDEGEIVINGYILGKEDAKIRSIMGTVFQEHVLDGLLTVEENMIVQSSFYYSEKEQLSLAVDNAAKSAGVSNYFKRPYGKLSGGQKRRSESMLLVALISMY
jgi:multidrug/hemolysin transport system ATP-binding protein